MNHTIQTPTDWQKSLYRAFNKAAENRERLKENAPAEHEGNFQNHNHHQSKKNFTTKPTINARRFYEIMGVKWSGKTKPNGERMALCAFHGDSNPSMSINLDSGLFRCFACNEGGDVYRYYMALKNCDFKTAKADLENMGV